MKARPASAHQENRDDLLPLLITALLHAAHGDTKQSEALFDEIIELEPDWADARYFNFWYLIALADLAVDEKKYADAERTLLKARATVEYSQQLDPKNGQTKHDLIVVLNGLGDLYKQQSDFERAKAHYQLALKDARELAKTISVNPTGRTEVSFTLNRLGDVATLQQDYALAEKYFLESLQIVEELTASDRTRESWHYDLMFTLRRMGDVSLDLNKLEQAKKYLNRSCQLAVQLSQNFPGNPFYQRELATSLELLGEVCLTRNELQDAESHFEQLLSINRDLLLTSQNDIWQQRALSVALNRVGETKKRLRKLDEAKQRADESIEIMEGLLASEKPDPVWQRELVVPLRLRMELAVINRDLTEEETIARRILEITRNQAKTNEESDRLQYEFVRSVGDLSVPLLAADKRTEARELLEEALPVYEKFEQAKLPAKASNQWRRDHSVALNRLAEIAQREKEFEQAQSYAETALEKIRAVAKADPNNFGREQDVVFTLRLLSRIALEQQAFDVATERANEVLKIRQAQVQRFQDATSMQEVAFAFFELAKIANVQQDGATERKHLKSTYDILKLIRKKDVPITGLLADAFPKMEQMFADEKPDDEKSDDKQPDDKQPDEKQPDEKQPDEKQPDEKQAAPPPK